MTVILGMTMVSCSLYASPTSLSSPTVSTKISSTLQLQVELKKAQLASPTPVRLAQMQAEGMNISNLNIQRIYIHLNQMLSPSQANELQAMGLTVYPDSWIPPAGNNSDGFYLADMPVYILDAIAARDYITRLDTAEESLKPLSDSK